MQTPSEALQSLMATPHKPAGFWSLARGRATTLRPRVPGVLRVGQGCVWITLDGPHERRAGDLFLQAGARLPIAAGQRVVLEPVLRDGQGDAAIDWQPSVAPAAWPAAVAQPALDLRLAAGAAVVALRAAVGAGVRLAGGLLSLLPAGLEFAIDRVARRDRGAMGSPAFNAHSSASRAQGCIKAGDSIASSGAL